MCWKNDFLNSADGGSRDRDKQDRTARIETRVRLAKDYSLLRLVNAVATAWSVRLLRLSSEAQRSLPVSVMATTSGVFEWRQIADFDAFFCFFL